MDAHRSPKTLFLRTLIGAFSAAAIIGVFIFLFGDFGDLEIRILLTTLVLGGFSLTGYGCAIIASRPRLRWFSLLGIGISVLGFLVTLLGIWEMWNSDWSWRITAGSIILSVAFAHASLLFQINPKTHAIYYIRMGTFVSIAIVAGMLIWATITEFENSDFYFRMLGVFAIIDVFGTVLMPVLNKITDKK